VSTRRRTLMAAAAEEEDFSSASDADQITSAIAQVQIQDKTPAAAVVEQTMSNANEDEAKDVVVPAVEGKPAPAEPEGGEEEVNTDTIDASTDEQDDRKMFIGGLSWETTVEELKEYFAKYGEVKDAVIKLDPYGRSRGFGFILFADSPSVEKVLAAESHSLKNKKIEPKKIVKAAARERVRKIFVGGVATDLAEDDIKEYFKTFGEIEDVELPFDKVKNERRAFCFVTFKDSAACDAASEKNKQELGGRTVDVKKAVPQHIHQRYMQTWAGFPRGRGRGGRGGYGGKPFGGVGGECGYGSYGSYGYFDYGYHPGYPAYYNYQDYGYGYWFLHDRHK